MSKRLANIMNLLVERGIFPNKMKHAKITPIYKTGNELLANINRLVEKLM